MTDRQAAEAAPLTPEEEAAIRADSGDERTIGLSRGMVRRLFATLDRERATLGQPADYSDAVLLDAILAIEDEADEARQRVMDAARDVDGMWSGEDDDIIQWLPETSEALNDLRAALGALTAREGGPPMTPRTEAGRSLLVALGNHAPWFVGGGEAAELEYIRAIEAEARDAVLADLAKQVEGLPLTGMGHDIPRRMVLDLISEIGGTND